MSQESAPSPREQYAADKGISYAEALSAPRYEIDQYKETIEDEQRQALSGFSAQDIESAKNELLALSQNGEISLSEAELNALDKNQLLELIDSYTTPEETPETTSVDTNDALRPEEENDAAEVTGATETTTTTPIPSKRSFRERFNLPRLPRVRALAAVALATFAATGLSSGLKSGNASAQLPGTAPITQPASPERSSSDSETHKQQFDFHFFDKNKESAHAFGAKGDSSSAEHALKDLESRYLGEDGKGDPSLVAAHAKQLGLHPGLNVNQLANRLQDKPSLFTSTVKEIKAINNSADIKLVESPADYGTFYMTLGKDGAPNVYYDNEVEHTDPGKALVLTKDGKTIAEYRIDCGFQPVTAHKPESVPTRQEVEETPAPASTATFTPKVGKPKPHKPTPTPKPTTTPTPSLDAKDPSKDINRNPDLNPDADTNGHIAGSGEQKPATDPPEAYTPPAQPTPTPAVERPATSIPPVETGANGTNGVNNGSAEQQPDANGV